MFRWGRWQEILSNNQFREGWRESDIEDCARVIVSSKLLHSTSFLQFLKANPPCSSPYVSIGNSGLANKCPICQSFFFLIVG
jgi:hypothetical protein